MAKCTECGSSVADDLEFCGYCGAKLNIVSEHVGTKILGNTEVVIGALERIAPGAVERPPEQDAVTTFNDGSEYLDRVWTCPDCGAGIHNTRGVGARVDLSWTEETAPSPLEGYSYRDGPHSFFNPLDSGLSLSFDEALRLALNPPFCLPPYFKKRNRPLVLNGQNCPICVCEALLSPRCEWIRWRKYGFGVLFDKNGNCRESDYRSRKDKRVAWAWQQWALGKRSAYGKLSTTAGRGIKRERDALSAVAAALPHLVSSPVDSSAAWFEYQRPFYAATMAVMVTRSFTLPIRKSEGRRPETWEVRFPFTAAMEEDAEAVSLREQLLRDDFVAP